jgi:NADH-quinone oxidoreductase subunit L
MTAPLIILAACSVLLSVVLTPAWPWLHGYLSGETAHFHFARLVQPMLFVSLALVAVGVGIGWLLYGKLAREDRQRPVELDSFEQAQPALFRFLANKMWLDELYDWTVVVLAKTTARFSDFMDRRVWDGLVRAFAGLSQFFGTLSASFDERGLNAGVDQATGGTRGLGRVLSSWHSGQVQIYLGVVAVGMLGLLILYAWLT